MSTLDTLDAIRYYVVLRNGAPAPDLAYANLGWAQAEVDAIRDGDSLHWTPAGDGAWTAIDRDTGDEWVIFRLRHAY